MVSSKTWLEDSFEVKIHFFLLHYEVLVDFLGKVTWLFEVHL